MATLLTIKLEGSNGDTITLADDSDYVLTTGVQGFGMPKASVRIDPVVGDGGLWRNTKKNIREIDLPIVILGNNRSDIEVKLRRLSRLLQDSSGPTKVIASYSNGKSVYVYAHFVTGGDAQFGADANERFCKWVITMQAPQPHWESGESSSFNIGSGNTGRGLLPRLTKLRMTSSQNLGVVTIMNDGDVAVYPTWTIKGPIEDLVITNGTETFGFSTPILGGVTYTVETANGRAYDDGGTSVYALLNPAPKLFQIKPGINQITITGSNFSPDSEVTCAYSPRYEVIF